MSSGEPRLTKRASFSGRSANARAIVSVRIRASSWARTSASIPGLGRRQHPDPICLGVGLGVPALEIGLEQARLVRQLGLPLLGLARQLSLGSARLTHQLGLQLELSLSAAGLGARPRGLGLSGLGGPAGRLVGLGREPAQRVGVHRARRQDLQIFDPCAQIAELPGGSSLYRLEQRGWIPGQLSEGPAARVAQHQGAERLLERPMLGSGQQVGLPRSAREPEPTVRQERIGGLHRPEGKRLDPDREQIAIEHLDLEPHPAAPSR